MGDALFEEGALSIARTALSGARAKLFDANGNDAAKRSAAVARLAAPWSPELIRRMGTHNLTAVISAATSRPSLSTISRKRGQAIFELWHPAQGSVGRGTGPPAQGSSGSSTTLLKVVSRGVEEYF